MNRGTQGLVSLIAAAVVACATGGRVDESEGPVDASASDAGADARAEAGPAPDGSATAEAGPPDAGCVPPPGATVCGLAPQCGCAANQTCDVTSTTGRTACVNAGAGKMGSPCAATSDCAVGLTCKLGGTCHAYCNAVGKDCGISGAGRCFQAKNSTGGDATNLKVCLINCTLDDPASCGGTAGCVTDGTVTDCGKVGTSRTTCPSPSDCAAGYTCANSGTGTSTCYKWCRGPGTVSTCSGLSTLCRAFNPAVIIDGVEYGGCYN